jgi:hypothetical protein
MNEKTQPEDDGLSPKDAARMGTKAGEPQTLQLPPAERAFVKEMKAFFTEDDNNKRWAMSTDQTIVIIEEIR